LSVKAHRIQLTLLELIKRSIKRLYKMVLQQWQLRGKGPQLFIFKS